MDILRKAASLSAANTFTNINTISSTSGATSNTASPLILVSTNAGNAGPFMSFYHNSASPAANDLAGGFTFYGKDSATNDEQVAQLYINYTDPTSTSEDAYFQFVTVVAGTLATRLRVGAGVWHPSVTGQDKGDNTINFGAVYDDNVLLTDYVFEKFLGVEVERSEVVAPLYEALDSSMFDPANYAAYWREHRKLWGMPDLSDVIDGRVKELSLGAMIQRLWQTVELQAIHIEALRAELVAQRAGEG